MTPLQKVIDKIKKLKALSTSSNPNEAALAAAEAQRLISEYQLDEESLTPSAESMQVVDEDLLPLVNRKRAEGWEEILSAGCCEANGCVSMITGWLDPWGPRVVERLRVIGTRQRADVVKALFPLLHAELQRLGRKQAEKGFEGLADFMIGAAHAVREKLKAECDAAKVRFKAAGNAKVLARIDDDLKRANEYADAKSTAGAADCAAPFARNAQAFYAGQAAGKGVETGVGQRRETEGPRLLGG